MKYLEWIIRTTIRTLQVIGIRLYALVMWSLYWIVPTDTYLRLNGYDPDDLIDMESDLWEYHE